MEARQINDIEAAKDFILSCLRFGQELNLDSSNVAMVETYREAFQQLTPRLLGENKGQDARNRIQEWALRNQLVVSI